MTNLHPATEGTTTDHRHGRTWFWVGVTLVLVAAVLAIRFAAPDSAWEAWLTLFVSILVQSTPFLVLGVAVSGAVAAFVTPRMMQRLRTKNEVASVATATCAGVLLPGCECGSVPISGQLIRSGLLPSAALAFMLAAPAINPVVIISTLVAFPGRPEMAAGRFVGSFLLALVMGLLWLRSRPPEQLLARLAASDTDGTRPRAAVFVETFQHDLLHAGGYLVIGAGAAAAIQAFVPGTILDEIASSPRLSILLMALLAVVMSICSEADAFVAASFSQVSPTAQLAFMVTGPAVDLKLVSMQIGVFGRRFAIRFAPLTFVLALAISAVVGRILL